MRRMLSAGALGALCLISKEGVLADPGLPEYRVRTAARADAPDAAHSMPPTSPNVVPAPRVRWELLGRSVEGRAIEFAQFGGGPRQVVVIGATAGDEPEGVAAAEALAANLTRFPRRIENVTITIVRDPNPDGRAKRTAANARGVVLDRNFPTARWIKVVQGPQLLSGRTPLSEPESAALIELIDDIKPDRVVLLGTASPKPTVMYAGPAEDLARQLTLEADGVLLPRDGERLAGSLLMLTGEDRGIPTVCLGLPPRVTGEEVLAVSKRAIMTAIGCGTPMPLPEITPRPPVASQSRRPVGAGRKQAVQVRAPFAAPSPYLGAYGVPTQNGPVASRPGSSSAAPSDPQPTTMEFQTISNGRPTVRIVSPRALRGLAPSAAAPEAPSTARPVIEGASRDRRLERLPPIAVGPPYGRSSSGRAALPQHPIPLYPETGPR